MRHSDNLLVIAPHPDDEILGCGGYVMLARQAGHRVRVVVLTDGAQGIDGGVAGVSVREEESRAGLKILGVEQIDFWRFPDGSIPLSGIIIDRLREIMELFSPSAILLPAPGDTHPDHRRATRLVLKALTKHWQGRLLFYEIVTPQQPVTRVVDITPVMDRKLEALHCHVSQTRQYDYEGNCRSLAQLRGISLGVPWAEAFLEYQWDGEPEIFFETRPLISV
ncbi:MAG: PIG-L deacetylase family protein, partial [Pseudomonadota bacterium]